MVREDFLEVVACEGALTHAKETLQNVVYRCSRTPRFPDLSPQSGPLFFSQAPKGLSVQLDWKCGGQGPPGSQGGS